MFANEREIENWMALFSGDHIAGPEPGQMPVAAMAARSLAALKDWTNANSDGWPYWKKPQAAAKRLLDLLHAADRRAWDGDWTDLDQADLDAALRPVKSFLTRQGADWREVLPAPDRRGSAP